MCKNTKWQNDNLYHFAISCLKHTPLQKFEYGYWTCQSKRFLVSQPGPYSFVLYPWYQTFHPYFMSVQCSFLYESPGHSESSSNLIYSSSVGMKCVTLFFLGKLHKLRVTTAWGKQESGEKCYSPFEPIFVRHYTLLYSTNPISQYPVHPHPTIH